jgi:hypothetical protein
MSHGVKEKSNNKQQQAKHFEEINKANDLDETINRKTGGRKEGGTTKRNSSTKKNSGPRPAHS